MRQIIEAQQHLEQASEQQREAVAAASQAAEQRRTIGQQATAQFNQEWAQKPSVQREQQRQREQERQHTRGPRMR